jgi:hypothetical protein
MKHLLVHVHYSITTGDPDQEPEQLHHDPDGALQGSQHPHLPRRNEVTRQSVLRIRIRRIRIFFGLLNPDPDPSITKQE